MELLKGLYEYINGDCSKEEFFNQFKDTVTDLKVGSVYVQHPNTWQESRYKVVFLDDRVALAVEITGCSVNIGAPGGYTVFSASGDFYGWKHGDKRSCYRLQNITD